MKQVFSLHANEEENRFSASLTVEQPGMWKERRKMKKTAAEILQSFFSSLRKFI
jgi:hypothetical protein